MPATPSSSFPDILLLGLVVEGDKASIIRAVFENACSKAGIDYRAVRSMATIGLKSDEEGILDLVKALQIPLDIIDLDDIKKFKPNLRGLTLLKKQ